MDGTAVQTHAELAAVELVTAPLRAAVDGLLAGDGVVFGGLTGVELVAALVEVETQKRRLAAVDHQLIHALTARGVAGDYAATSTTDLLVSTLRVTPADARTRITHADDLGPRHTLTGEPLDPILPATAAAVRAGDISGGHIEVIARCLDRIPADIAHAASAPAEGYLLAAARHEHPTALARTAQQLLAHLDPDGREPRDDDTERRRSFTLVKNPDGSAKPRGLLTPEVTALWEAIFDSLAAPTPSDADLPDTRTADQRRHDALADAATRLIRSDTLPTTGGSPVTIIATTTLTEWEAAQRGTPIDIGARAGLGTRTDLAGFGFGTSGARPGTARTAHGDAWTMRTLRLAGCGEATITTMLTTDSGGVLALGRTRRLASSHQRLALAARDGGCCFPGCDRPAAWAEVHHIIEWTNNGPTDIDNLCLLCRYHHRHFQQAGWSVRITHDGSPEWLPPAFLDPTQQPRRNTTHHLRHFTFHHPPSPHVPSRPAPHPTTAEPDPRHSAPWALKLARPEKGVRGRNVLRRVDRRVVRRVVRPVVAGRTECLGVPPARARHPPAGRPGATPCRCRPTHLQR